MAKKYNARKSKKVRNLVAMCCLCAILLSVSTYAWFIGMKTVNVAEFSVNIATTEGLFLSMDGKSWKYTLDARNADAYTGHANQWLDGEDEGLIPMSSVGDMDKKSSRMKLYEKGSLTAVTGGYRLLASQVDNHTTQVGSGSAEYVEGNGYVAFDLFIKNLSGNEYYTQNNPLNEEAIYLTTNSEVKVSQNGGKEKAGIENSVRVAFAQIGRVKADTESVSNITKITCSDVAAGAEQVQVTGICREARIWEPNDSVHVQNAVNWYDKSCLTRKADGDDVNDAASYNAGSHCATVELNQAYPTYAISNEIAIADNINIYDGAAYNGYTKSTIDYTTYYNDDDRSTYNLVDMTYDEDAGIGYFTDTMKNIAGKDRPQFMTLAPNSITKVRVYIWIEGQDVDNYDFASLGKKITINFGFTKERYNQSDFPDYDGPDVPTTNE